MLCDHCRFRLPVCSRLAELWPVTNDDAIEPAIACKCSPPGSATTGEHRGKYQTHTGEHGDQPYLVPFPPPSEKLFIAGWQCLGIPRRHPFVDRDVDEDGDEASDQSPAAGREQYIKRSPVSLVCQGRKSRQEGPADAGHRDRNRNPAVELLKEFDVGGSRHVERVLAERDPKRPTRGEGNQHRRAEEKNTS